MMVRLSEERLAVTLRQGPGIDEIDHLVGKVKETDGVGEVGAAASQALCEPTGCHAEVT
jgi:hypothetical protein